MDAPRLGSCAAPARDYTWSVSDDGGASFRNPTTEEMAEFLAELRRLCRDCVDAGADGVEHSIILPCGHIAHPSCHVPEGYVSCAFGSMVDIIETANALREANTP